MTIQIGENTYRGRASEILERLRNETMDWIDCPDTESYILRLQENYIRMTDKQCPLPKAPVEQRAYTMLLLLADIGALQMLEDN